MLLTSSTGWHTIVLFLLTNKFKISGKLWTQDLGNTYYGSIKTGLD